MSITQKVQCSIFAFIVCIIALPFLRSSLRGDITPVAFSGQPAPGIPDARFDAVGVGGASINASRNMAFAATLDVQGVQGAGIYQISGGVLSAVALSGGPLPDGSGRSFGLDLGSPQINDAGDIVFTSDFASGQAVLSGIFLYSGGTLSKLV